MRSYLMIGLGGVALILGATVASAKMEARRLGQDPAIPAGATQVVARLQASPRHAEWVTVKTGANDSVRAWLVYPERRDNAPVVVVIHEIFGLSNWVRGVADQLAADGFIAIAPDLLTMRNLPKTPAGEPVPDSARAVIGSASDTEHQRRARLVAEYAMKLPAASRKYGIVGYCWGGQFVWQHAIRYPDVAAVVSYYGGTPAAGQYAPIKAPVLGLYGSNDGRVNMTIPRADSAMKVLGKKFQHNTFEGAGHGFLRAQDEPANLEASKKAWPMAVNWFRSNLR
jgi:carboxymethylenebutenolidase